MLTRFQFDAKFDAKSWRALVLGLLLLVAFAHAVHVCPGMAEASGSGPGSSSAAPCLLCVAMQAIALTLVFAFVGLTLAPVRSYALIPTAPVRPAYRLSLFTRPPPTF